MQYPPIKTSRLILRPWIEADREPWAILNQDPRVMEYFPVEFRSRKESDAGFARIQDHFKNHGYGFWAVELPNVSPFIGFIGIKWINFEAPFAPALEVGWRLAYEHWGKGYAPEGALASLEFAFKTLNIPEVVAITAIQNMRSRRVMDKIGMQYSPQEDFDHPAVPEGHPLRRHVLYRIKAESFEAHKNQRTGPLSEYRS